MKHKQVINADVVIAGGGLAGLTLAQQLKNGDPNLDITVIEKNTFPVPEAVAKVGESTVEIGSHYLKETIGLSDHFDQHHLQKFGLRCFFGEKQNDFAKQDELGVSESFGLPAYQIDRGRIENHLATRLADQGVNILDGYTTTSIDLSDKTKRLNATSGEGDIQCNSRWMIDAAGRQTLIRNHLALARKTEHCGNAIWFRLDKDIRLDDWSTCQSWQERCSPQGHRWLSTNHLMGPGYWVWIIPLASGITSVGIVCDDQALKQSGINKKEDVIPWLQQNQPYLAEAISDAQFLDFHLVRDFSFDSKQVYSSDGWAMTGEAAAFSDPFYSPGSDFIAIGNCMITELINNETKGKDHGFQAAIYQKIFASTFNNTMALYNLTYGGFGDRQYMGLKLLWDYSYYWAVPTLLSFHGALSDIPMMQKLSPILKRAQKQHQEIQLLFQHHAKARRVLPAAGVFINQYNLPCLRYFNHVLKDYQNVDLADQIKINVGMLDRIGFYVAEMLGDNPSHSYGDDESDLLGDYRKVVLT